MSLNLMEKGKNLTFVQNSDITRHRVVPYAK